MKRAALALAAIALLGASNGPGVTTVSYNTTKIPLLECSTVSGCEVVLLPGDFMKQGAQATIPDDRFTGMVEDEGGNGSPARILVKPSSATELGADGKPRTLVSTLYVIAFRPNGKKREYVVGLAATDRADPHRVVFEDRSAPAVVIKPAARAPVVVAMAAPLPTPLPAQEADEVTLRPSEMDAGWAVDPKSDPELKCVLVFNVRQQVWCKLPHDQEQAPSAYVIDGTHRRPLNTTMYAGRYVVISGGASPIELVVGGERPRHATIVRARE